MLDVILLGDGFTTAASFRDALEDWLAAFYALRVYELFAGCLRVRALYTPSSEPASSRRDSFYRCKLAADGRSLEKDGWQSAGDADGIAFRSALWAGVDTFADANPRRYPLDLDVGASDQAITNDRLRDLYRNLVVGMLVSSAATSHPSGFTSDVSRPSPDQSRHVRVAFGANEIHEFSHAFGLLSDEYINGRDSENDGRVNPPRKSVSRSRTSATPNASTSCRGCTCPRAAASRAAPAARIRRRWWAGCGSAAACTAASGTRNTAA